MSTIFINRKTSFGKNDWDIWTTPLPKPAISARGTNRNTKKCSGPVIPGIVPGVLGCVSKKIAWRNRKWGSCPYKQTQ